MHKDGEKLMSRNKMVAVAAACAAMLLAGCETTDMKMGSAESKTVATGSAAGSATPARPTNSSAAPRRWAPCR